MSRIKGTPSDGSDFEREVGVSQPLELRGLSFVGIAAILVVIVFFGCGKKQDQQPSSLPVSDKALPPMVVDPTTAGSISGGAFLDGSLPVIRPVDMGSEPACAKANSSPATDVPVLAGDGGALANAVVYVKGGLASQRFDSPRQPAVLDQKGCVYEPRVIALMTNQPLQIRNDDATIHNVHAMAKANGEWNKAQRPGAAPLETSFARPELAIPFMCNVHPWMRAFVFVFDHPYYSVTPREGKFALHNLPPGTYMIEAWHERLGTQDQMVTIGPRESKTISFRFKSSQISGH
jgi:hypothetical protein